MADVSRLQDYLAQASDLGRARALLAWDERTHMPPAGAEARSEQLATLARLRHERLISGELGRMLDELEPQVAEMPFDSFEASLVRVARRDWAKARLVPVELRAELSRVSSLSEHAWVEARERSDFAGLLPHLERVVELRRRYVECFAPYDHSYDPLLDDFEPGMTTAELKPVLESLRAGVEPLVAAIRESDADVDASCLHGHFEPTRQAELSRRVLATLPLEEGAWRMDETVHPFATGIAISDLRITTRFDPSYIGACLWAVIHEGGHALYQNGIAPEFQRTPLCRSVSLGFDESQSRMWENWVGRGKPYLHFIRPLLAEAFPEAFSDIDANGLYRAANRVEPSLIRVEADEVTYNLHIALRFELEVEIFEGGLELADLPEAWNERMGSSLGVEVPDDANGVLQDVHWPSGSFGYFPTYSLGNVIAGQIWDLAREELSDLDAQLERGETRPLGEFLRERLYRHGCVRQPREMIEELTGGPLDTGPVVRQLWEKYGEIYSLKEPAGFRA
jgi:carboxypeptidase Taq